MTFETKFNYAIHFKYSEILIHKYFKLTATLPGMWERTVTFGSAGKAFSATGAKVNIQWIRHYSTDLIFETFNA